MHELSIAQSIIDIVTQESENRNLDRIKAIGVKIGALSGILPDALEFGFDALKKDTDLTDTILEIEEIPVSGNCKDCMKSFEVKDLIFTCPNCGSGSIELEKGQELDLAYLEIEENSGVLNE